MQSKPEGLDWNMCLGWLPKIAWDPKRYFNRFAYWDFSTGGQTGGLFVHMIDVVHWYLGLTRPVSAVALGGIYKYKDGRDTADNINAVLDYPQELNVTFEASLTDMVPKESADIVFMGAGGRLHIFRSGYRFIPPDRNAPEIRGTGTPEAAHMRNWLDCVRDHKEPNANVLDGHYGSLACHIMNMAYREKKRVLWKPEWDV
jgi:predicted dehydrogenase